MTLAQLAELSQTVSSIGVVCSLIFVGVELRLNAKATRAASHHAVTDALNQINILWARDEDVSRIWLAGLRDREALTQVERWRFDSTVRAYMHVCETMYTQAGLGAGDSGIVIAEEMGIRSIFMAAGVKAWWAENPFGFSKDFRTYVGKVISLRA